MLASLSLGAALLASTPAAEAARTLVYDGAERIALIREGARESRFEYDGRGGLVTTCRRASPRASWVCEELLRDDRPRHSRVVAVLGATDRRIAHGPAGPLADDRWSLVDALGTPRARVNAAGLVDGQRAFDAFGLERTARVRGDLGFGGEWQDASWIDLRARTYAPDLGRFLQRDTVALGGWTMQGLHRYAYAGNRPLVVSDPSGRAWDWVPDAINAGISAKQCVDALGDPCASNSQKAWDCGLAAVDIGLGIIPFIPAGLGRFDDVARYGDDVGDAMRARPELGIGSGPNDVPDGLGEEARRLWEQMTPKQREAARKRLQERGGLPPPSGPRKDLADALEQTMRLPPNQRADAFEQMAGEISQKYPAWNAERVETPQGTIFYGTNEHPPPAVMFEKGGGFRRGKYIDGRVQ
jgi:RHS repeat-associated protein